MTQIDALQVILSSSFGLHNIVNIMKILRFLQNIIYRVVVFFFEGQSLMQPVALSPAGGEEKGLVGQQEQPTP